MAALPRLVALSPGDLVPARYEAFLEALARTFEAGLAGLLLREPLLGDRDYLALGREVARLRTARTWLAVHDRAHLAAELMADAVHLSFRSLRPAELRTWLDPRIALGLSTHAGDDARTWTEADYLFHGPVRATPSKAGRIGPVGLAGIGRALARTDRPLFALGGVQPMDVPALRALGAHGVAVLSGVLGARDPERAVRAYLAALAGSSRAQAPE